MTLHALVAYATTHGSTAELARCVARTLRDQGLEAEALPAAQVTDVDAYDVVVIGSALSLGRWHRDARRLVRRHREALRRRAVWAFSSGPLDSTASDRDIPPVPSARRALDKVHARGHVTFGGRLEPGATGRLARMILDEGRGGDFRDWDAVASWARDIAAEAEAPESA
ncbi:flavodoxin domain-containing protein [Streptomyces sp. NPDC006296]|uniref:flavodoxin domain-containing protein n=1 Tax=Streptomyces sp. NPDC006296 TaxID=3156746 RepID=UPI0033A4E9D3